MEVRRGSAQLKMGSIMDLASDRLNDPKKPWGLPKPTPYLLLGGIINLA